MSVEVKCIGKGLSALRTQECRSSQQHNLSLHTSTAHTSAADTSAADTAATVLQQKSASDSHRTGQLFGPHLGAENCPDAYQNTAPAPSSLSPGCCCMGHHGSPPQWSAHRC